MLNGGKNAEADGLSDSAHGSDAPADAIEDQNIKDQIADLVSDVRKLADSEIAYYRAKLSINLAATKKVAILFGLALVIAVVAVIALILGILLIVSTYFGPIIATAAVTGSALVIAGIFAYMAIIQLRKLPLDEKSI